MKKDVTALHEENKNLKDKVSKKLIVLDHYSIIDQWNDVNALSEDGRKQLASEEVRANADAVDLDLSLNDEH